MTTAPPDPGLLIAVVTGAFGLAVAFLTGVFALRSHRDTNLRDDVKGLRAEVAALRRENRLLIDYVHALRNDLDESGEDVRPWPDGLTT